MLAGGIWQRSPRPGKPGSQGGFWLINNNGDEVWFKNFRQIETANEYIVSVLGAELGVPIPTVRFNPTLETGECLKGSISFAVRESFQWTILPEEAKTNPINHIINIDEVRLGFILDVWVNNTDRNHGNILYREEGDKYRVYFIDHGRTINCPDGQLVAQRKCLEQRYQRIDDFYYGDQKIRNFFYSSISRLPDIEGQVVKVESFDDTIIEQTVELIPNDILEVNQKEIAIECLKKRKQMIRKFLVAWASTHNKS